MLKTYEVIFHNVNGVFKRSLGVFDKRGKATACIRQHKADMLAPMFPGDKPMKDRGHTYEIVVKLT